MWRTNLNGGAKSCLILGDLKITGQSLPGTERESSNMLAKKQSEQRRKMKVSAWESARDEQGLPDRLRWFEVNFILLNSPLTTSRTNPGSFTFARELHRTGDTHRGCSDARKEGCTGDKGCCSLQLQTCLSRSKWLWSFPVFKKTEAPSAS